VDDWWELPARARISGECSGWRRDDKAGDVPGGEEETASEARALTKEKEKEERESV